MHDWTLDGVHLCTTRLELLELNTMDALDHRILADVDALRGHSGAELRHLGRLAHPMRRRLGEPGFTRITWAEALDVLCGSLRSTTPERMALYLTSRGLTNETYYVAGKAARAIGTPNVDSAARVCHAPSTVGLKGSIGVAASTCSLRDVLESDLIVLWGTNPANNQPVFMKYLHLAKERGARVVVVNPFLEPGLERYWVPSLAESAVFGTRICDLHVPVRVGGDIAFATAALKLLDERGRFDSSFVDEHTEGVDELRSSLAQASLEDLLAAAGVDLATLEAFVQLYGSAGASVLIWSMGITQHTFGVDGVRSIANLALARGNIGRNGAGLMPIRGHSGVQGGAEMGAYASALPGGVSLTDQSAAELSAHWGFEVPSHIGLTAPEMLEAAAACAAGRAVVLRWQLPRRTPGPGHGPYRPSQRRAAGTPGHRGQLPDARGRARTFSCCPLPPATSRRVAGPRPPPNEGWPSPRRSPARWEKPVRSGGCSRRWPRGCVPS